MRQSLYWHQFHGNAHFPGYVTNPVLFTFKYEVLTHTKLSNIPYCFYTGTNTTNICKCCQTIF